ncbi:MULTISPECIES: hypothetical protein [Streptomyces]|uniref:Uncharacterized protein n=1 Tax=Streptomyces dengpaensis TaxID=2049881 RepID=A0ABN5I4D6_9ACTN|nr:MULTISPECIES: hypothetical protein [Streptomyces]AVH57882.1 hypothetical protein C4B68_21320 [Streptomyces dengpaensis]PIB03935.1 hypothetical protein B1C81_35400 [Streptomyces sp. HG99]
MAETETIYVLGEGGGVHAMDVPLPEPIQDRLTRGLLRRVNKDGSPYQGTATGEDTRAGAKDGDDPAHPPSPDGRPAQSAPKSEWIGYVVRLGKLSAEDAANYTKADLIDLAS